MGWDSKEKIFLNRDGPNCHLPARELISRPLTAAARHRRGQKESEGTERREHVMQKDHSQALSG